MAHPAFFFGLARMLNTAGIRRRLQVIQWAARINRQVLQIIEGAHNALSIPEIPPLARPCPAAAPAADCSPLVNPLLP